MKAVSNLKRLSTIAVLLSLALTGLGAAPAHAVSDRDVACSGGGYFKVRGNKVVPKQGAESAFANRCKGTAVIPDGVTEIDNDGMNSENQMSNIVIPDSVTKIGGRGLADTALTSINLPAGLTYLSQGALGFNGFLTTLVIPASVTTIETFVLFGAHGLCNVYFLGTTAPNTAVGAFNGICESSPWTTGAPTGDGNPKAWPPQGASGYGALGDSFRGLTVSSGAAVVLFDANGADSGSVPTTQVLTSGTVIQLPADAGSLTRANFTFLGWSTSKDGEGQNYSPSASYTALEGTTILYANWLGDPKVKYNGNGNTGGSAPVDPDSPHAKNSSVTVLGNSGSLTKTGSTFDGWNTQADGSGTTYQPSSTFTIAESSVTLYAKWIAETHTVTYDGNGNTGGQVPVDAVAHSYNSSVTVLGNSGSLAKTGYTFAGWNTAADGTGTDQAASSTFTITSSDVVLYAKWTPRQFGVSYLGNGNTGGNAPGGPLPHAFGSSVTVSGNTGSLVKTGYAFDGWNTAADGSGTNRAAGSTFTMGGDNLTLYAKWAIQSYTVTYNGNGSDGGTLPTDTFSPHQFGGNVFVYYQGALSKEGFVFAGWNTAADGSGTQYGYPAMFYMPASNVVLYAQWATPFTVTYDGNGSSDGTAPVDAISPYPSGSSVICQSNSGNLVKSGYKLTSWNSAADGSGATCNPTESFTVTANTTWYAQWTLAHTVTYNGNGNDFGSPFVDENSPYAQGDHADVASRGSLARDGYFFTGWNTAADGSGDVVDQGEAQLLIGTSDVVLYAQWRPFLTVSYHGNGNTGGSVPPAVEELVVDEAVTVAGNTGHLVKTGYTFAGWNTEADGSGFDVKPGVNQIEMENSNIELYAQWKKNAVMKTEASTSFTGFEFFKSTLSKDQKREIRSWLKLHKGLKHVSCVGYTGFNSSKASRGALRSLGKNRARNVCSYIHRVNRSIAITSITTVQSKSKSNNSRKVLVKLY
jgi:uncharacterized repeat protein (TIGR02543 family)